MEYRYRVYSLVVSVVAGASILALAAPSTASSCRRGACLNVKARKTRKGKKHGHAFTIHGAFQPGDLSCAGIPECEPLLDMVSFEIHGKILGSRLERHGHRRYKKTRYLIRDLVLHRISGRCISVTAGSNPTSNVQYSPWTELARNLTLPVNKVATIEWKAPGYVNPETHTEVDPYTGGNIRRPVVGLAHYKGDTPGVDSGGIDLYASLTRYRGPRRIVHSFGVVVDVLVNDSYHDGNTHGYTACNGGNMSSHALPSKVIPRG
jgi:hypothetical protein